MTCEAAMTRFVVMAWKHCSGCGGERPTEPWLFPLLLSYLLVRTFAAEEKGLCVPQALYCPTMCVR